VIDAAFQNGNDGVSDFAGAYPGGHFSHEWQAKRARKWDGRKGGREDNAK
jgi:hypothetical protein